MSHLSSRVTSWPVVSVRFSRSHHALHSCWIRRPGMSQLKHRPCINIGPLRATNDRVKPEYRSVVPPTFYEINRLLKSTPIGPRKAGRCRGRDQQKSSSSSLTIGLHIIAARVRFGEEFGQRRLKGYESSHLCHNRECFNPQHVYLESKRANLARDACRDREEVTVDGKKVLTCEHGDVDSEIPFCTLRRLIIETVPYKTITGGVAAYQREQAKQMIRRARKDCNFYVEV